MRKIAISDIHGCHLSFLSLLDKIALTTADELYLLGDYIDRGPDSKKVLEKIIQLSEEGYQVHSLAGNHDFGIMDARTDPVFFNDWYNGWGGKQTMEGFGVNDLEQVPQRYWSFLNGLDLFFEIDGFIFVHAGLDFTAKDPLKPDINMLYIRNWYEQIKYDWLGDRIVVHGHTPIPVYQIERMLGGLDNRQVIDIDAGCFAKHLPGKGHLCAFDLTNRELHFQKCLDDVSSYWK